MLYMANAFASEIYREQCCAQQMRFTGSIHASIPDGKLKRGHILMLDGFRPASVRPEAATSSLLTR